MAPETLIGGVPVGDITASEGECQTLLGLSPRSPSFCKGKADLYRVTMKSGREVLVTLQHRFLTPKGWLPLNKLDVGSLLAADGSEYAIHDLGKATDLKGDCLRELRRGDAQLHPIQAFYLDRIRQPFSQIFDDETNQYKIFHPSIACSMSQMHHPLSFEGSCRAFASSCESPRHRLHKGDQDHLLTFLRDTAEQHRPSEACGSACAFPCQHKFQNDEGFWKSGFDAYQESQQDDADFAHIGTQSRLFPKCPYFSPMSNKNGSQEQLEKPNENTLKSLLRIGVLPYTNSFWDEIQDIAFERHGEFYDLSVPMLEHYSANGLWHHNSGKSYVGAYDLIFRAMSERGRGRLYMVVAPTYVILQDASMRTVVQIAEELGVIKERWKQPPRLVLNNGSEIIFRSGDDPEKLRGPNLSGVWMDEASLMSKEAYSVCIACLREAGQAGWLSATFTPKGISHWTYEVFATNKNNTQLFRSSTTENPFLPGEFIDALKGQYSDRQASQEISGEFVDQEGCEWPASHFTGHIWFDEWPAAHAITVKAIGLDPSKGSDSKHGDYCAIVKLARTSEGILYCEADLERIDAERIVSSVCREQQLFNADVVAIETNQFQHLLANQITTESRKRQINMPVVSYHNRVSKDVRIRRLGPHLANKNFRFKANHEGTRVLVNQLREFPLSKYDDGPDALEMALRGMIQLHNGRNAPQYLRGIRA